MKIHAAKFRRDFITINWIDDDRGALTFICYKERKHDPLECPNCGAAMLALGPVMANSLNQAAE